MVNFAEENVCTGVDPQECARIANVLSLETAVQGEEIARLQGVLEQYLSREDDRANHEKILGIGDAANRNLQEGPFSFFLLPSPQPYFPCSKATLCMQRHVPLFTFTVLFEINR